MERLLLKGIRKRFGPTVALDGVDLVLEAGEVLALIGENGAGKSTLMKILSGAETPDSGQILVDGHPFIPGNPLHARQAGIAMVYQELTLAPHLTVAENIFLGSERHRFGWTLDREMAEISRRVLAGVGLPGLAPETPVESLTIAHRQLVEIARALFWEPRILVLDEPTSSLSSAEAEDLFQVVRRLRGQGISTIFISHFLEDCARVGDRYAVLRDGRSVGHGPLEGTPQEEIIRLMVGRDVSEIYPRVAHEPGEEILQVGNLAGTTRPRRASFSLRRGEILGVAGLVGSGRTETLRVLFGLDRLEAGRVAVFSRESSAATPFERIRQGFGYVSEDRKQEGLMLERSIAENMTLSSPGRISRRGWLNLREEASRAVELGQGLRLKSASPFQPAGELSGGNQQKVALCRLLHQDALVWLLDEPTRGIDVSSKVEIYRLLGSLAARGRSVLLVSSYLPELLGVCDRIAVMSRGVLVEVRDTSAWTAHELMEKALSIPSETPDTASA